MLYSMPGKLSTTFLSGVVRRRGAGLWVRSGCGRSGVQRGFGGVADAVLVGGFGLVHGRVGAGDELLGRLRVDGEAGDAEGGRELEVQAAPAREGVFADAL